MLEDFSDIKPRGLEPINIKIDLSKVRMDRVNVYDIKETKELVVALCNLSNTVLDSLEDGSIGISDIPRLILIFPKLITGVAGINQIPKELSDLTADEKLEIIEAVKNELDLNDNVEAIVEQALNILYQIKYLLDLIKNLSIAA